MTLESFDYYGNAAMRLHGEHITLDFLAHAGPRLVGLRLTGREQNILAELPNLSWDTPNGVFHAYGGHRLWQSPEYPEKTYFPDDEGLMVQEIENGVELLGAPEMPTGIRRAMRVTLDPVRPIVTIAHRIENVSGQALILAPWAVTQLPLGGAAYLPQTVGVYPPAEPSAIFWANRHIALWNYTRWDDPRLHVTDGHIRVSGDALVPPCKIGYLNTRGWAAYLRAGMLFVKRFTPQPQYPHPDRHSNVEVYVNDAFLELETLAPLVSLAPGETVEHVEQWELIDNIPADAGFEKISEIVEQK